ncbi:uncharacterized protein [Periplaneta americana]|uniref:uncharacterized protein isoform X2 n=1 Tax=Periplaneta americana TaxID=6978 RepID=UPI0037E73276
MKFFTAVAFISVMACIPGISEGGSRNYVLLPTRLSDVTCNKDYIEISKLKVQKFNKTMSVVKGTFILKKDFPETSNCSVVGYQNTGGGKYRRGSVDLMPTKCCDFFENDKSIWPAVLKATNVPIKCPLKKPGTTFTADLTVPLCWKREFVDMEVRSLSHVQRHKSPSSELW